jgi:hypothetical protein
MEKDMQIGQSLSDAQVKLLRQWIDAGAIWPDALAGDLSALNHVPRASGKLSKSNLSISK